LKKFEYSDSKSHKFWNIKHKGSTVTTNYGRIGTKGQTKVKELSDSATATKEFEKLIKQKTSKGYEEVGDSASSSSGGGGSARREFHFVSGASAKFWAIELNGTSFDVTYGKIGTDGTTKTKDFASDEKASAACEKLIAEKTGKGYEEVSGSDNGESNGGLKSMMFGTTKDANFQNLSTFIGQRVVEFKSEKSVKKGHGCYRIGCSWEDESTPFDAIFKTFLESEAPASSTGLVIGSWSLDGPEPSGKIVKQIADNKKLFPNLVAIFFGDITQEQNEISWIENGDMSPLLTAFPNLEMLRVRGGTDLALKKPAHKKLRALGIETGGLSKSFVASLCKSKFPELEHLEIWLGTQDYGGDCRVNDLQPILKGKLFPKLKYLGLRNSEIVDEICGVIVSSPIISQLETLDLSLGTMTDEGGKALLSLPTDAKLKRLNLQHHFMSPKILKELKKLPFTLNVKDRQEPDDWGEGEFRFVRLGMPPATVIAYSDLIDRPEILRTVDREAVVRIDSPGENEAVQRKLIALGSEAARSQGCHWIESEYAMKLPEDRGRIRYLRQWFLGFQVLINRIQADLANGRAFYNHPEEILLMFDKPRCQAALAAKDVATATAAGPLGSYQEIIQWMDQQQWKRVFIKPAHSSSASGVIALTCFGNQLRAVTSVETEIVGAETRYYNNLNLRTYTDPAAIEAMIDFFCRDGVQVEMWLPKLKQEGRNIDLRMVVINGEACHSVVRSSQSPITNLHLGNRRGNLDSLIEFVGVEKWERIRQTACRAASIVPRSLYVGVDVLVKPGNHQPIVLELNAFGDLLPNVDFKGFDVWESQIRRLPQHLEKLHLGGEE